MAIQSEMQSFREHDVYQEVTEDERWTVPSENIIPGKSVFTIKREGIKKVRIVGCGNFQKDTGIAVFTVNVNVITVRVVMLIAGNVWMVLDRNRCKNCLFCTHLWTDRRIFTYLHLCCVGRVSLKRVLCGGSRKLFKDFVQLRGSGVSQEMLFAAFW